VSQSHSVDGSNDAAFRCQCCCKFGVYERRILSQCYLWILSLVLYFNFCHLGLFSLCLQWHRVQNCSPVLSRNCSRLFTSTHSGDSCATLWQEARSSRICLPQQRRRSCCQQAYNSHLYRGILFDITRNRYKIDAVLGLLLQFIVQQWVLELLFQWKKRRKKMSRWQWRRGNSGNVAIMTQQSKKSQNSLMKMCSSFD